MKTNEVEIEPKVLSDKSIAYNVVLKTGDDKPIIFACTHKKHAEDLKKNLSKVCWIETAE